MGQVISIEGFSSVDAGIADVAAVLAEGGVAVVPTDTVYGIAQSVLANPQGPRRIFSIKRRDESKVVPWLVGSPHDLETYGDAVPAYAFELARAFWPGGLTLVVPASRHVPTAYRAADGTVALRMPNCAPVLDIVRMVQSPLATTSANTSGLPAPVDPQEIEPRIVAESDVTLVAGPTPNAVASTVVVCSGPAPAITRVGAISKERIRCVLQGI